MFLYYKTMTFTRLQAVTIATLQGVKDSESMEHGMEGQPINDAVSQTL
jgi:hypothetical protein